jgi:hypothetical protein
MLAVLPLAAAAVPSNAVAAEAKLKIMIKSAWGSDDPTKAAFPFLHGDALSEAGHEVQIFLLGEAVSLMRIGVAGAREIEARGYAQAHRAAVTYSVSHADAVMVT